MPIPTLPVLLTKTRVCAAWPFGFVAITNPDSAFITDLTPRLNLTPSQRQSLEEHGIIPEGLTGQSLTSSGDYRNLEKELPEDIEEKDLKFKKLKKLFSGE